MLFLLAMEALHLLFSHAQETGALSFLHANRERFRMSLYIDDATVFINPTKQDYIMTKHILQLFGEATCLISNMNKTEIYPIRYQEINLGLGK
jgi:hypothetical protein